MPSGFTLTFPHQPDLAATMDIQIPALAWQPAGGGRWQRTYHVDAHPVTVEVREADHALRFTYRANGQRAARVRERLTAAFATMIADLTLNTHPVLAAMQQRYRGVIVMAAEPFEALVLTILSQNRTGEIVRQVYPTLAQATGGATPDQLATIGVDRLAALIRSAGPYKAARLAKTASIVAAIGLDGFDRIVRTTGPQALVFLESLPGVAHKTAACVLIFAAGSRITLPVDTHLFRVVDRLGLARHDGRNTKTVRDTLIDALLRYGPDLAPAHFLFLLVGRSTCVAATPRCGACFLADHCAFGTVRRSEH